MDDEDKLRIAAERGSRAQALLENELFNEAFDKLDAEYIKQWRGSDPLEDRARENLWKALKITDIVRQHIKSIVNDGKIAAANLALSV